MRRRLAGARRPLEGHPDAVWGALPLPDGRRALSWSRDHTLRFWDLESGDSRPLEGHTDRILGVLPLQSQAPIGI